MWSLYIQDVSRLEPDVCTSQTRTLCKIQWLEWLRALNMAFGLAKNGMWDALEYPAAGSSLEGGALDQTWFNINYYNLLLSHPPSCEGVNVGSIGYAPISPPSYLPPPTPEEPDPDDIPITIL